MAFTYDPSTPRGKVRLFARDTVEASSIFTDAEVDAFLELQEDDVKLAAADALDTVASNQVLLLKKVKVGDLGTDGPAVAAALRQHAQTLRSQVYGVDQVAFDVAEMGLTSFNRREILGNDFLRG